MIAQFINLSLQGKPLPKLKEFLPDDEIKDYNIEDEEFRAAHNGMTKQEYDQMCWQKEMFMDQAIARNKKRKKEG